MSSKEELFEKAEELSTLMQNELKSLMESEVSEHYFEMAMEAVANKPAFQETTLEFMGAVEQMTHIVVFLDNFREGTVNAFVRRSQWEEIEEAAGSAVDDPMNGHKIKASKLLREAIPGLLLTEAKWMVEEFMQYGVWSKNAMKIIQNLQKINK